MPALVILYFASDPMRRIKRMRAGRYRAAFGGGAPQSKTSGHADWIRAAGPFRPVIHLIW